MKKLKLLLVLFLFTSFFVNAQEPSKKEGRAERIQALKVAFISEELNLTTTEAEKFWPIYNTFDKKLRELERQEKRKLKEKIQKAGGINAISEKEAKSFTNKLFDIDKEIYKTKLTFNNELKKVLTYKKLLQLKIAEKDFLRKLMKRYRGRQRK